MGAGVSEFGCRTYSAARPEVGPYHDPLFAYPVSRLSHGLRFPRLEILEVAFERSAGGIDPDQRFAGEIN